MRKQLVALTLSAAMAAGMLSGCGGYGSGSGGQKDAAEAAAAGTAASTAAAGSGGGGGGAPAWYPISRLYTALRKRHLYPSVPDVFPLLQFHPL